MLHASITYLLSSYTMSARPLDNAAPTIYAPSAEASSSRRKSGKAVLWEDTGLDGYEDEARSGSESEGREEIDSEEVYGGYICLIAKCWRCQ